LTRPAPLTSSRLEAQRTVFVSSPTMLPPPVGVGLFLALQVAVHNVPKTSAPPELPTTWMRFTSRLVRRLSTLLTGRR
jgi:hypothetical protein